MDTILTKKEELIEKYKAKKMEEQTKKAWQAIMKTKHGRWLFIHILIMTGYVGETFTGNSQTFYNEGRRSVGIQLDRELMTMLKKEGFDAKQKAEREFVEFQYQLEKLVGKENIDE